jgi:hypothetical protein
MKTGVNQFFYHFESFLPGFKIFLCYNISRMLKLNGDERGGCKWEETFLRFWWALITIPPMLVICGDVLTMSTI